MHAILLTALLASQTWTATEGVSLVGAGWVSFGDRVELNDAECLAIKIVTSRDATGWHSAARQLVARHGGSAKKQLLIKVEPLGGPGAVSFNVADSATGDYVSHYIPDAPAGTMPFVGRNPYMLGFVFRHGRLDAWVNGVQVDPIGSAPLPTSLTSIDGVDLTVGGPDFLQANVSDFAVWTGCDQVRDDPILWRSVFFNQYETADLASGVVRGHDGSRVIIPEPRWWWPMSGDALPIVSPRVGNVFGLVTPGPGSKTTRIPRSPVRPPDAVAEYRFELADGTDLSSPPHMHSTGLILDGGQLCLACTPGTNHLAPNQETYLYCSSDLGQTWPWRNRRWPGDRHDPILAYSTPDSFRGHSLVVAPGGRWLHFGNFRLIDDTTPLYRFVHVRHSDNKGLTWSPWRNTVDIGSRFTSIGGGSSKIAVRSDGGISFSPYVRSWIPGSEPPQEQGWYDAVVVTSWDSGLTWTQTGTIALGAPSTQWEECQIGSLQSGRWMALCRLDYPIPAGIHRFFSEDEGETWGPGTRIFNGRNWPVWRQLDDGTVLAMTREVSGPSNGHSVLYWSHDGGESWLGGVDLLNPSTQEAYNVGHSFALLPNGKVGVMMTHEIDTLAGGQTRLEWLVLRPLWEGP